MTPVLKWVEQDILRIQAKELVKEEALLIIMQQPMQDWEINKALCQCQVAEAAEAQARWTLQDKIAAKTKGKQTKTSMPTVEVVNQE